MTHVGTVSTEASERRLSLAPGVRLRPEPFGGMAFTPRTGTLVILAPAAYTLLVDLGSEGPPVPITEQAEAAIHRLVRSGIVVDSPA